jgi:hypothetical protein
MGAGQRTAWIAWTGLVAGILTVAACSSNNPTATTASASASPTPVQVSGPSPSAQQSPCPDGVSTSATTTSAFSTAQAAGIAATEVKTTTCYCAGGCVTQPFLTCAQVFGNADPSIGLDAAYVQVGEQGGSPNLVCYAYVFYDSTGWHYTTPVVCPTKSGFNPVMGTQDHVNVPGSCANVRATPSITSRIVTCLKDGTVVSIDTIFPRYVDGHIWWSINAQAGWVAHDFLITA